MNKKKQKAAIIGKRNFSPKLFLILYIPILLFSFFYTYSHAFDRKIDLGGDNAAYYILGKAIATGQGYTDIQTKEKIANNHFPPGYPLIIAAASKLFSNKIVFIKKVNGFFFFLAVGMLFLVIYELTGNYHIPFITSLFVLFNFFLLRYSTIMMSGIPFLFFSTLCLWLVIKTDFTKPLKKNWLFFILIICISFTYQVRSVGIALLAGIVLFLALDKRWKYLSTLVGGFILLALPWYIRSKRLGGNAYISELLQKNPYRPGLGRLDIAGFFTRFWHNLERYITREIPSGTFDFIKVTSYKHPYTVEEWIFGIAVLLVMIFGLIKLKRFRLLFLFYLIATFGILLLWPEVWVGTRFMLPLIPLLTFLFINGIIELFSLFGLRVLKIKNQSVIYITFVILSLLGIKSYANGSLKVLETIANDPFPKNYQNYFKIAEWINKHAPENSVTCCRKESLFFMYSGKYVTGFEDTDNREKEIKNLEKQGTDYVVLDHLGYSSTGRYLYPAMKRYPNKFQMIMHLKNSKTYLFKFEPQLGYTGLWKNNKRDGFGTFRWKNGLIFEGMWKNNVRNGRGILFNPNGEQLDGYWKNDKLNGLAEVKSKDGRVVEIIIYKNNHPVKEYKKR